jgi:hypothetical protein
LGAQMVGCCRVMAEVPAEAVVTRVAPVPVPQIDHGF